MATMKSKGTVYKVTISSVLTAVPGITTIDKSGEESETTDIRSLDGGVGLPLAATGFVKPCVVTLSILYDAANSVHAFLKTAMRTVAFPNAQTLTYTDVGPVTETYSCVGIGVDESFDGTKAVEAKVKLTMSGLATTS